ncbi:MAG: hypothetical protein IJ365_07840 [Clostridia bacterium]|nr:hypothetical protein [Clostridia bacterium]
MNYVILCISMLACIVGNILRKYSGDRFQNKKVMYHVYNGCLSAAAAAALIIVGGIPQISLFTLGLGIMFGVVTALQSVFQLKAYDKGPMSYTTVIVTLSSVIPALSGYFIWGEKIVPIQIVGIGFMIASFVCFADFSGKEKSTSVQWFVFSIAAFVCTGIIGVTQKYQQTTVYKHQLDGFLVVAFAASFIYSAIIVLFSATRQSRDANAALKKEITPVLIAVAAIAGCCAAGNNKMNIYLSGVIDSAVFFPVVNAGGLIMSTIADMVLFKEKIQPLKWLGMAVGLISVILLCNPF